MLCIKVNYEQDMGRHTKDTKDDGKIPKMIILVWSYKTSYSEL